jgi:hypothetical protein
MPKKGSRKKMRSKKESRVGQSGWKKGSRGAYRAPNSVSVKTANNNRAAVANNAGVNTKIGLSNDILRPLSKFAQDLNKKLSEVSNVPTNLKTFFIDACVNINTCFDSSNLDKFPGLNEANTRVNNGNDPADQARLCQYLSKLSQEVVYKNAKFMAKRSKLMFATMKKYFDKQARPVKATRKSARLLRMSSSSSSARSSTRRNARSSTLGSAKSTSSGPPSNSPPPPPSSNKSSSSSASSNVRRGLNLYNNFTLNSQPLVGNCNVESKVKEIQKALNECSNVKIRQSILTKLINQN